LITIKRYANRKLYNPETRQYITLDILARMIRQGKEVRVIDHATASDLTRQVLT
jgi:polyhydroxyalkanoate synthesis repressor PhaR